MNKIRIAVFNTQPPHLYFGGVERRILETGKRLSSEVDFRVYSGTKAGFYKPIAIDGVKIVPCQSTDRAYPLDNWTFNRTQSKMADQIKAEVYEAHTASGYGIQRALRKRGKLVPFVQTVHGVLADEAERQQQQGKMSTRDKIANYFMKRLAQLEAEAARNASIIVTISKYSQKKIEELYQVDPEKIRIVPNGVDPDRFKKSNGCEQFKKRIGADERQTVLFVGRLIPRKGLHYLVEAAKSVVDENGKTLFAIVGDGPLKAHLISEVKNVGLDQNFAFLGDLSEEELPAAYSCSDVFAFPSIQEGQGIAVLEAQASSVPVVAFRVSGVAEAVEEGETGILSDPNSSSLAEGILKLLADDSLRKKMGAKGRQFVLNGYTWDICAQKMKSVYLEAFANK
jgi:glycogen(starch) synthase